jgi:hypothetical protein
MDIFSQILRYTAHWYMMRKPQITLTIHKIAGVSISWRVIGHKASDEKRNTAERTHFFVRPCRIRIKAWYCKIYQIILRNNTTIICVCITQYGATMSDRYRLSVSRFIPASMSMALSEHAESDIKYFSDKIMFFYNCSHLTYIL